MGEGWLLSLVGWGAGWGCCCWLRLLLLFLLLAALGCGVGRVCGSCRFVFVRSLSCWLSAAGLGWVLVRLLCRVGFVLPLAVACLSCRVGFVLPLAVACLSFACAAPPCCSAGSWPALSLWGLLTNLVSVRTTAGAFPL